MAGELLRQSPFIDWDLFTLQAILYSIEIFLFDGRDLVDAGDPTIGPGESSGLEIAPAGVLVFDNGS